MRRHPFRNGAAGKCWLQGFLLRHKLTLHSPQPLSHARARCSSDEVVRDFFEKLGGNLCSPELTLEANAGSQFG